MKGISEKLTFKHFEDLGVDINTMTFSGYEDSSQIIHGMGAECRKGNYAYTFVNGPSPKLCSNCFSSIGAAGGKTTLDLFLEFSIAREKVAKLKELAERGSIEEIEAVLRLLKILHYGINPVPSVIPKVVTKASQARTVINFYTQIEKETKEHFQFFKLLLLDDAENMRPFFTLHEMPPLNAPSEKPMMKKFSLLSVSPDFHKDNNYVRFDFEAQALACFTLAYQEELKIFPVIEVPTFVAQAMVKLFTGVEVCFAEDQPLAPDILENTQRLYSRDPSSVYSALEATFKAAKAL